MSAPETSEPLTLADASLRLRRRPGRPRKYPEKYTDSRHVAGTSSSASRVNSGPQRRPEVQQTPAPVPSTARLLSVRQASAYLGLSTWTVRDLIGRGSLRRVVIPGVRRLLLDRVELDDLVSRGRR